MTGKSSEWDAVYRYGSESNQTDGYWVFAPMLEGEIELFQLGTLLMGEAPISFATAVVSSTSGVQHLRIPRGSAEKVVRSDEEFRIELEPYFALSSDEPHEVFRIQTTDPKHSVTADLEIRPASGHPWPTKGYRYETTHGSTIEGTITIDGTAHAVSTICAFEHAVYLPPSADAEPVSMPPFWHYEYVVWAGDRTPFGSLVWHVLDGDGAQIDVSSFTTSYPADQDTTYDSYELSYTEIGEFQGEPVPWAWTVSATKGDEHFSYRARVRQSLAFDPRGAGFLADVLVDCEGTYRGPQGETSIRGRGRSEFYVISYNPAAETTGA